MPQLQDLGSKKMRRRALKLALPSVFKVYMNATELFFWNFLFRESRSTPKSMQKRQEADELFPVFAEPFR